MNCPNCHSENPEDSRFCKNCSTPLPFEDDTLAYGAKASRSARHLQVLLERGHLVEGNFEVVETLGGGGMGTVYKALDKRLNRLVALKFIRRDLTDKPEYRRRFLREAQAASQLDHPNICSIHEIRETAEGQMFIVMPYYAGETLKAKVLRGPLPYSQALDFLRQIASGLAQAHREGIVHRDIKPANIMVTRDQSVKILDFGLAKTGDDSEFRRSTGVMGTLAYMSPEQARGEPVSPQSDVWSLGVTLYEMLTGRLPFAQDNPSAVLNAIFNEAPLPPSEFVPDIPQELEKLIFKCLRKDKATRYETAAEVLADLAEAQGKLVPQAPAALRPAPAQPAARVTDRRRATVLVAEISGYDDILTEGNVEEAAAILGRCFAAFGGIVQKYGGLLEKVSRNTMVASFGVLEAIEDETRRAVNAAIALRNEIDRFNREEPAAVPLGVHVGVDTGTVVAAPLDTLDERGRSLIGEAVDVATYLKDISAKGQILVGPATFKATQAEFEYRPGRPAAGKGAKKTLALYELLSARERIHRGRPAAGWMIASEIVGREAELARLKLQVMKVLNGEGGIVNIVGEAGIGKTRLLVELGRLEDFRKVRFLKGRSVSIGKNLSYYPLIDLLKNWAGLAEDDSPAAAFRKLETGIAAACPADFQEVVPFIASLMGMKLPPPYAERLRGIEGEGLEKLTMKNIRELLQRLARTSPVVLVMEDLHWADESSIALLESLYLLARDNPVLFINIMRPNYASTSGRILETIRDRYSGRQVDIVLEALDGAHSELLISNLLRVKSLPAAVTQAINERAEGNPFFIEEVARALVDEGAVVLESGRFRITDRIDSVVIPKTIEELVLARVDKLEEDTKSLVKIASVIGRSFFRKILVQAAASITDVDRRLRSLKEMQLILERQRLDEVEYLFKHTLAQEAVYHSLPLKTQKELHLRVAEAIETCFAERLHEFYGMLAFHYSQAENPDKAGEYLARAGEESLKAAASSEALHYFQEALKLYLRKPRAGEDPETILHLQKQIAIATYNKGYMEEAVQHFDRVLKSLGEKLPRSKSLQILALVRDLASVLKALYLPLKRSRRPPGPQMNLIVDLVHKRGTTLATVDNYRMFVHSVGLLRQLNRVDISKLEKGASMYIQGSTLFSFSGVSFKISKKLLEYPREYIAHGGRKAFIDYKFGQLMHGLLSGEWGEGLSYDENIVDDCAKSGELWTAAVYLVWSGIYLTELGQFAGAEACIRKLQEIGETYDHDYARSRQFVVSARTYLKKREWDRAWQEAEEGVRFSSKIGHSLNLINFNGLMAHMQILRGDMPGAEKSLAVAEDLVRQEKRVAPFEISSYHLSRFLFDIRRLEEAAQTGNRKAARDFRRKAAASGREARRTASKYAPLRAETYRFMGDLLWLSGRRKKAMAWYQDSKETAENLGAEPELARTYLAISRRLKSAAGPEERWDGLTAAEYQHKAATLFWALGLTGEVELGPNGSLP